MRRILKIGGSLLRDASLPDRLNRWLNEQPSAQTIAIVGGGELIDAMRGLDATYGCPPAWIHWRCVDLLRVSFDFLGGSLPGWNRVSSAANFDALKEQPLDGAAHFVAVDAFYRRDTESPLPETWATTTDAIAGWLSIVLDADELVLLKSCDVPVDKSLDELSREGIIDQALPLLSQNLCRIRYVNFAAGSESS